MLTKAAGKTTVHAPAHAQWPNHCEAATRLMKTPILRCTVLALVFLVCTVCTSRSQGVVFTFSLLDQEPGASIYGGFGSFTMDASAGQFQVNVVFPYDGDSLTPLIITPSGSLSFLLGTGTPATFPFGSFGDFMSGVSYAGSFQSSSAAYSDLLSGLGQFQLTADSGLRLTGGIVQPAPEPSVSILFVCGLISFLCLRLTRANNSPKPPTAVGAVSSAVAVRVASRRWFSFCR